MEGCKASVERLTRLVLLIAIAYTITALHGLKIKELGQQKYINRLLEVGRICKRHSNFWVGQYGLLWIAAMEKWSDLAQELMKSKPVGIAFFSVGTASHNLYSICDKRPLVTPSVSDHSISAPAYLKHPKISTSASACFKYPTIRHRPVKTLQRFNGGTGLSKTLTSNFSIPQTPNFLLKSVWRFFFLAS